MMLTIHGLPLSAKYHDLKRLIKEKCNIGDYILDNLVSEGDGTKKVRVGLADEREGSYLMKCLDGTRMSGNILRVVPVGKPASANAPENFDQRSGGYPPRNDYPNQSGPNYGQPGRPMEPMRQPDPGRSDPPRQDPWAPANNQWAPNQMGQPMQQDNYNYQQPQINTPYGHPNQDARPDIRPQYDQRDQYQGRGPTQNQGYGGLRNDLPDHGPTMRHPDSRAHVLRSVEIIEEPLNRTRVPDRYPAQSYDHHQKPMTIMKDNFQGPQYTDRPQGPYSEPDSQLHPGAAGHHQSNAPGHMGSAQPSPWAQPKLKPSSGKITNKDGDVKDATSASETDDNQPDKSSFGKPSSNFDRKYPETDKRPVIGKPALDLASNSYLSKETRPMMGKPALEPRSQDPFNKDYGQAKPGPRFSPRRDGPDVSGRRMPSPGRKMSSPDRRMPSPGRRMPSPGRRILSPGRRMPSPGRRMLSPGRRMPSPSRRMPSPGRRMPSPGRKITSPGRRMPSPGRRILSPGRRMPSPGRRILSPGRKMPSPGRRILSPGRRMPSPGRRILSPGHRMPSPGKRMSPGRRMSPPGRRRDSPPRRPPSPGRYSPSRRRLEPASDKYAEDRSSVKDVRPAYDPPSQVDKNSAYTNGHSKNHAPNQAMYSAGYRPSLHENVQYPIAGARLSEQRPSPWQERDKTFPVGPKKDDERRMPKFEPRIDPELKRSRSPRKSRSPKRRDRSPIRDRFKKHSPSPRSPRRSWALEKRRSPEIHEAPPPPIWPGQPREDVQFRRFPERVEEEKKRVPVWEPRRPEDERKFENTLRVRTDLSERPREDPSPRSGYKPDDKYPPRGPKFESKEPRFEPREEFRRGDDMSKRFERDFRDIQRPIDQSRTDSRHEHRRDEFPRGDFAHREEERKVPKVPETFNKEFEDVYKRAQELNKRAEELRRREERRRDEFQRRDSPEREPKFDRRDDRHDFRREERREPEWKTQDRRPIMSPSLKAKREKAVDEIANKIFEKQGSHITGEMKTRVMDELKIVVDKIMNEMFGYNDVSFIEMVIKFNAKYDDKAGARMYNDVLSSLPNHFRSIKRQANEPMGRSEVPAKSARRSHETDLNRGVMTQPAKETYIPEWKANTPSPQPPMMVKLPPPTLHIPNPMLMPQFDMMQQMGLMVPQPLMVPAPTYGSFNTTYDSSMQINSLQEPDTKPIREEPREEDYNLYLCKDDFEPYTDVQAEYLKRFLISELLKASQTGHGWSPDFTLKGLQSVFRYVVETRDDATKEWLFNLDFSEFQLFNVLVYTKEELWYERAAVWLPGHSRCRNIEPLTKLKLQNRKLEGVNIGKWKFVKKLITVKGTRIYVDMPPSSARALEKHKMMLSYELQKVSVFLKAVAVDKDVFDSGLNAPSIKDPAELVAAAQNSPMPSLGHDPNIVKICLKGNKALSLQQARKIKEMIIYHIFKYHQDNPNGLSTDFLKYGFCLPGYFGLLPENEESKRWLMTLNIGKLNKHVVVVLGPDEASTKYIKMSVLLEKEPSRNSALVFERLKQSNQGLKGVNFHMWKPLNVYSNRDRYDDYDTVFDIEMDLESVETIMKLKYNLDYVDDRHVQQTAIVRYSEDGHRSKHSSCSSRLEKLIKQLKSEMSDSYDVANMDIASSDEENDIVYMGTVQ